MIELRHLSKTYSTKNASHEVLHDIKLEAASLPVQLSEVNLAVISSNLCVLIKG